jgi:putative membrane protein
MHAFLTSAATRVALVWAAVAAVYAAVVVSLDTSLDAVEHPVTEVAFALGTGLLLGLRVNRAYERWWEGRTLWGTLVNVSRNLAVKAKEFAGLQEEESAELARELAGFAYALKDHLRQGVRVQDVPGFADRPEEPVHVPVWITAQIYARLHRWLKEGRILPEEMRTIDREARVLLDVCGACERIKNTLMPPSLGALTLIVMVPAILGFPLAFDEALGWWIVPTTALFAFFLLVGETTASIIERPFGTDANQLDLDRLCVVIRESTAEALGAPVT